MTEYQAQSSTTTEVFDEEMARHAIDIADLNALRLALYQITGEEGLANLHLEQEPVRDGAMYMTVVAAADREEVKARALDYLRANFGRPAPPPPDRVEACRLIRIFAGDDTMPEALLRFGYEQLAFEDFPRGVDWPAQPSAQALSNFNVAIIGAGISGIAAAIQLHRLRIPFVVIERQPGIGGTWQLNRYPDARVDTTSYIYQYTFEKYKWSEYFASRDENVRYLEHVAQKYGVRDKIRLGTSLTEARWDEELSKWQLCLQSADGARDTLAVNVVISASGLFSTSKVPDIPGIRSFEGELFHSTEMEAEFPLDGKRVAIIGTGSTGSQMMPAIARRAEELAIFQRNPQWVSFLPNYRHKVQPEVHWLHDHFPYYWNWYLLTMHLTQLEMQKCQTHDREWQRQGGTISERNDRLRQSLADYIRHIVGHDPELYQKCLPPYAPLVRRLVVSNGWYEALCRPNVHLITEPIDRFTPHGIATRDGAEYAFDTVILATGFQVAKYLWPVDYVGRDGTTLEDLWHTDGARAYLGMVMPKFPNFFMFYGPNGQPRAASFHTWAEAWSRYVAQAIVALIMQNADSIEVREDVFTDYNDRMDEATKELLWTEEGSSYYVNEHGRSGVNLPWETTIYHEWIARMNPDDFDLRRADGVAVGALGAEPARDVGCWRLDKSVSDTVGDPALQQRRAASAGKGVEE